MKGLILKDIYNLATLFRIYTILPILAIVISYSQHSLGMLQFLPALSVCLRQSAPLLMMNKVILTALR